MDEDDALGLHGYYRAFIAEALAHPEGLGFPKFSRGLGRELIDLTRRTAGATREGIPDGLVDGDWYAMTREPFSRESRDGLYVFVGQAYTLGRDAADWHFREGGTSVTAENEGYGRIVPSHEILIYNPWIAKGRKLVRLDAATAETVRSYAEPPLRGTSKLMTAFLKTV